MPRNMSFALTTDQIRNQSKTVTRRLGWKFLKAGDIVNACVKCMGLKPGEKIQRLGQIRIKDVRREPLEHMETIAEFSHLPRSGIKDYGHIEAAKEGFPSMTGSEFVKMFCEHMDCIPSDEVTRIEFEYV